MLLIPQNKLKLDYNSYGFRGSEFEETKPDNTFRIIAIGGSTTLGEGVEDEFTWPSQLQKKLNELDPEKDIEIINVGVGAASSFHNYKLIKNKLTSFEPDLFIIFEGANDQGCFVPEYHNTYTKWTKKEILYDCGEHPPEEHALIMAERYSEICELGKKIGFDVIVTIQPTNEFEGKILTTQELNQIFGHPLRGIHIDNHKILTKTILEKTNSCSAVVNLTRVFDDYDLPLYADRVHTGNLGYEIIAENILDNVVPILVEKNILNEKPNNLEKIPKNKFEFGQDLKYSDFSGKDLENKNFFGADLRGSNFEGAILSNADFRLANLENANFTNAKIDNIKLRQNNLKHADFSNVDFSQVNLMNVYLTNVILKNSNLSNKDLTKTFLYKSDLFGADLSNSNLSSVYLKDTVLKDANLTNALLYEADLSLVLDKDLSGTVLVWADITWSNLVGVDFSGKDLTGVNFKNSDLTDQDFTDNVSFFGNNFKGTELSNATFEGVNLSAKSVFGVFENNAPLKILEITKSFLTYIYYNMIVISTGVDGDTFPLNFVVINNFAEANLENANFKNADLKFSNFYRANLSNADLSGADLRKAFLDSANLSGANLQGVDLSGADLSGANLSGADLSGAVYDQYTILKCVGHPICV